MRQYTMQVFNRFGNTVGYTEHMNQQAIEPLFRSVYSGINYDFLGGDLKSGFSYFVKDNEHTVTVRAIRHW